jgi:triphosphatase
VIPVVAGSSPVGHPTFQAPLAQFTAVQRASLERIETNRVAFLRSGNPDNLHQLRVGLRRLRSALRAFEAILPQKKAKRLARDARRAMRKLAAARDWDVFVAWLEQAHPRSEALMPARRMQHEARLAAQDAAGELSLEPLRPKARDLPVALVLEGLERKTRKQARRMDWADPAERHELRIRVKRLRYASEFFGHRRAALERLQGVLGELNDVEVARELLRGIDADAEPLYRALAERERRLLGRLARMKTSAVGQASGRRG